MSNYTKRKQKFDWKNRLRMTKGFSQFLFENLDETFKHEIKYELLDYPPRLMVYLTCHIDDIQKTYALYEQIEAYCKKWDFVWKMWMINPTIVELKVMYQLTYTFEVYKEPKYEPYTESKEDN